MRVVCVQAHGAFVPGDVTEVPDGAAVSGLHWAAVSDSAAPDGPPAQSPAPVPETPGGGEDASPPPGPGTIPVPVSTPRLSSPGFSAPADKETSE